MAAGREEKILRKLEDEGVTPDEMAWLCRQRRQYENWGWNLPDLYFSLTDRLWFWLDTSVSDQTLRFWDPELREFIGM